LTGADRLGAALSGDWDRVGPLGPVDLDAVLADARAHRVDLLLAAGAGGTGAPWPDRLREDMRQRLREAAAVTSARVHSLKRLLEALADRSIEVLIVKGVALANTIYPSPHLRPHRDIDLLIRAEALERAEEALFATGWQRELEPDGEKMTSQRHYRSAAVVTDYVDLHWKVAIPHVFADMLEFGELAARARPVPSLGRGARVPADEDSLLIACLHRVAHHQDGLDLLWLWDIHLLVQRLDDRAAEAFAERASRARMGAIAARGLTLARHYFRTALAPGLVERLESAWRGEPSARFLGGGFRQIDLLRSDLRTLPDWGSRLGLLREHLFPPRRYMKSLYRQCPAPLLPLAYCHRIVRGAPKWLKRPGL
jgi:hypothetical protein